jgi:hypothetical protein
MAASSRGAAVSIAYATAPVGKNPSRTTGSSTRKRRSDV